MGGASSQPTYTISNINISSSGTLTLPISDFNGYTSLKLIATIGFTKIVSNIISYQYLPLKPSFIIQPGTSFDIASPQITLVPNEELGSSSLNHLDYLDLSLDFIINNNKVTIQTNSSTYVQEVTVNGQTYDEGYFFYTMALVKQNYLITFNPEKFSTIMSMIDPTGN
ncbi:hypothetical protein IKS57_06195 [bacterium]|nr:hypothetical protein [bacterium]